MKKLKVIRQTLEILENPINLLHIFLYDEKYKNWNIVITCNDYMDMDNVSKCIADGLNEYGADKFEIDYNPQWFNCECCGFYTIDTTTISKDGVSIEIVEDSHLGYSTRGWDDAEIIEDWKLFGYEVEIIDYKEEEECI